MKNNDTRLIYNRIKLAYDLSTDLKLANFLGITPQVIPTSIARGTVQWDKIFQKCEFLSIDWLLTGQGKIFRTSSENTTNNETLLTTIDILNQVILDQRKEIEGLKKERLQDATDVNHGSSEKVG